MVTSDAAVRPVADPPLPRLSAALGGEVEIWAKREDCNSGIAFGGNKVRKLEYLVAEALAQGCDTLVSIGGVQSNHTRQVTGVAPPRPGRVTVQEDWVDWPTSIYDKVGNIQLTRIMGGDIRMDPGRVRHRHARQLEAGARLGDRGRRQAVPDPGRRVRPPARRPRLRQLGARGRRAGAELGVFFDHVVVCTVTGSTHAGMIAGFALEDRDDRGSSASTRPQTLEKTVDQVTRIAATRPRPSAERDLRDDEITVVDGYAGPVYGIPDERRSRPSTWPRAPRGMLTDPVYEGKSMAGASGFSLPASPLPNGNGVTSQARVWPSTWRPCSRSPWSTTACEPRYAGLHRVG